MKRIALRGRHLFLYDLVAITVAIVGAFALRFDANNVLGSLRPYLPIVLLPLVIQPLCNVAFGLYRREWRYASVREMGGDLPGPVRPRRAGHGRPAALLLRP